MYIFTTLMKANNLLFFFFLIISFSSFAQENYTLSGFVKDAKNGEVIIGANIYLSSDASEGTVSNIYGFYSISVPAGQQKIVVSYIGYQSQEIELDIKSNQKHNFDLKEENNILAEVVITSERKDENVKNTKLGTIELSSDRIKSIPAFMGEVDIIKALQLMPGVQAAGEGNSGIYVRGGGPDQNLVLLDDAIVYNPGHLFGFFSVFNNDAVKNVTLVKGAMPANYGGRLSSVIDVQMKEGNNKKFQMEGGLGLISSRLTLQAPIQKNKSSFLISGRRTYAFDIAQPALKKTDFAGTNYFFYDINLKANYIISDKSRLYISGYFGRDVFVYNSKENQTNVKIPWGNITSTIRYNHIISPKLFMNVSFIFNDYKFSFTGKQTDFSFKANSGVRDYNVKIDFDYYLSNKHLLKFGYDYTHHRMTPTLASATSDTTEFKTDKISKKYSHEMAWYVQHEWEISKKVKLDMGFRLSFFQHIGPYKEINGMDTIQYKRGKAIQPYVGYEPRLAMRYAINESSSIKTGLSLNYQYIHLVSNSNSTLPTDVWVQSTARVKPQQALQFNLGYFKNFKENMYEMSVEFYYKQLWNQIEYTESYVSELDVDPELSYVFGKGKAYGAEFFIRKNKGKLNGWIGYTISRSDRKFSNLNNGNVFPTKYDRPHDLSVNLAYNLNNEWQFGTTFVYASGNTMTPVIGAFVTEGALGFIYGKRNSYRIPAYHRMDLSLTYTPIPKRKPNRRWQSSYNFSIYNVYSRKNVYFIYNKIKGSIASGDIRVQPIQVSLFPIIPSFTWNFKF
ncbi:MAG TPA: carboxypeptidase-like regulatory domain-containing protein [Chitinophagales bacterium]|nr:carboxypeptidase-like regulatory domain-containing protein [Chitinophagales bacterium]HMV01988.1 carboxypeptidase-like regulatory domain-containing protein [Chitinophagales bacterium]HMW93368.1 carboxypeptidase-like regulatory domain-containing protein [Chitinophagales bacterium]HMY41694.1 carboxypeptidase-like regulatory domain-containing protein [Chitinophagales bacterium]HMZ67936.1 carboxypeptidase-like regulatory domain-containing protein [Chitinophagales bacterium]